MAFNAATEWDVRTTGNDANGGGFQVGSTGTDRSQSDAAYQAYTDIVIDGTTNTKITSAAYPFDETSVGNIINITAGTGFTVQRVQIVSQAAGVATCDKAVGTVGSTGGTGNLGGGLATIAAANTLKVIGNTIHIKAGTYTLTATVTIAASSIHLIGYQTTHRDGGTRPLVTSATNDVDLLTYNSGSTFSTPSHLVQNINFSHTAASRGNGITNTTSRTYLALVDCIFTGFDRGVSNLVNGASLTAHNVVFTACVYGVRGPGNDQATWMSFYHCSFLGNATGDLSIPSYTGTVSLIGNLFAGCGGTSVDLTSAGNTLQRLLLIGNTFAGAAGSAVQATDASWNGYHLPLILINNIFYDNGAYGISVGNVTYKVYGVVNRNNAFGANTTADRNNVDAGADDVTLTADPFTNAAGGDYSLNDAAGGGAACKTAGYQVT